MRGKKIDSSFVSSFILDCVSKGKSNQNEIVGEARYIISIIDEKIKEVEKLKKERSKLMDVIISLDNEKRPVEQIENLHLFKIQNQEICKFICDTLKEKSLNVKLLKNSKFDLQDTLFTVKQLIENKVIVKNDDYLSKGSEFNTYLKIVLMEK